MSAADLLLETARRGELHHAIILHGPSAAVLRDLAMRIAKTLNCLEGSKGDGCSACQRIERHLHPDVHFIEVGEERKLISVEQIREIVANAAMRPYEGRNKVFIIDPASALTASGSNSLLKTLEEPPGGTHFILITRSPDLLLPTIRSRSQSIHVGGEEAADPGMRRELTALLARYGEKGETAVLLAVAALVGGADDPREAIAALAAVLRDAAAGDGELRAVQSRVPTGRLLAAADGALAAIRGLAVNADPRLLVEQALANLVTPGA